MPIFIHGWIEATGTTDAEREYPHSWRGIVNLSALLMDEGDGIAEYLFGLSKRAISEGSTGILGGRGVPLNPSSELQACISSIQVSGDTGSFGGYTSALWTELASVALDPRALSTSRWGTAFALAQVLVDHGHFSPDQLRFTVWYSW